MSHIPLNSGNYTERTVKGTFRITQLVKKTGIV